MQSGRNYKNFSFASHSFQGTINLCRQWKIMIESERTQPCPYAFKRISSIRTVNVQLTPYMSAKRMRTFLPFLCIFGVRKNARLKEKFSLIFPFLYLPFDLWKEGKKLIKPLYIAINGVQNQRCLSGFGSGFCSKKDRVSRWSYTMKIIGILCLQINLYNVF